MRTTFIPLVIISLLSIVLTITGCSKNRHKVKDNSSVEIAPQSGILEGYIKIGKRNRKYLIYVPPSYDRRHPTKLLLGMHPGLSNPQNFIEQTNFTAIARRENFIAVFPQGSARNERRERYIWNAGSCCGYASDNNIDDIGFIRALIKQLESSYNIDKRNIFATGFSNGGGMSYRLACQLSEKISSIAVVSSSLDIKNCSLKENVNVMHIHGTSDPYNPYYGGTSRAGFGKVIKNSTQSSLGVMLAQNKCTSRPQIRRTADLTYYEYSCQDNTQVTHIKIDKGEHAWPGSTMISKSRKQTQQKTSQNLNASETIWQFFESNSNR